MHKHPNEQIAQDTLSGNAHFQAWSAVVKAIKDTDPLAFNDRSKSPVE